MNYPLHNGVWPYTGLDFGPIPSEKDLDEGKARWYHWIRMLMGFKPSPYIAVKMTLIAEEVVRGNRHDEENPFHWTTTRTNLPGSADYDPRKSWIAKIRKDGSLAADLFTFVDVERVMCCVAGDWGLCINLTEKWNKLRRYLEEWFNRIDSGDE